MRRWFLLSLSDLVTYFAYPASPSWWADQYRGPVDATRISTTDWKAIGLDGVGNTINALRV